MQTSDNDHAREMIAALQRDFDVLGLRYYLGTATSHGRRAHPTDPYGHTRAFFERYGPQERTEATIAIFRTLGCTSDDEITRWLLRHDDLIE